MPDTHTYENNDLLSICALLRWFDRDVIRALVGEDDEKIEALMMSDLMTPAAGLAGAYQLREDIRADVLARLHAERPSDESTWHRRIFDYFRRRMQESTSGAQYEADEDSLLYHLGALFLLIAARQEWRTLAELITVVRTIGPQQVRLQRWLSFYEAFTAIRTQDYDRGEVILTTLLSHIDVEDKLRVQVLNALGQAHWFQARYDRALALYRGALTLAQQTDDLFYQGIALANMGWTYEAIQLYDQALHLAIESLAIFRRLGDSHREGHALYDIGMYALRLGRWEVAQSHFQEAITLYEALHNQAVLAYLYWGRGLLFHLFGDEAESEAAYLHAQTTAETQADGQTGWRLISSFS